MERTTADRAGDPVIGRLLDGRYLVGERIARGGMATVYQAMDQRLERTVAIKVMHVGMAEDPDFASRFKREAQAAARLAHHNVVAVFDQGEDAGTLFLVMEYVPGSTLRELMRREAPMPPLRALTVIEPVLAALQAAHEAGMIHRDVKPENVLLAPDGRVKVADFGLARAVNAETRHTSTGVLIGTVSYLAPELVVAAQTDPRVDVYAAGVLIYEMLTGKKPHQADSPIQVAYKHVHEDIPAPSLLHAGLPAYVDALVARATVRDTTLRPTDAGVLLRQLRRVRAALEQGVTDDPDLVADLAPYPHRTSAPDPFEDTDDQMPAAVVPLAQAPQVRGGGDGFFDQLAEDGEDDQQGWAEEPWDDRDGVTEVVRTPLADPYGALDETGDFDPQFTADRIPAQSAVPPAARREQPVAVAPRGRSTRRRRGPLLLVAALVVALVIGLGAWWFGYGRWTDTPGVVNMSQAAARTRVQQAGLTFEVAGSSYNEDVARGSVLRTDPEPGDRVLDDGTVRAEISLGPERHDVPNVRGKSLDEAQQLLADAKLAYGKQIGTYNEKVAKGAVISASPKVGTALRRNTAVNLTVSRGRQPIQVPSYVGEDADKASAALKALGLEVSEEEAFSDSVPSGTVIAQDPSSGTRYRGAPVALSVSKGSKQVAVPAVQGMKQGDAVKTLKKAGLKVKPVRSSQFTGLGYAIGTNPAAGTKVDRGKRIVLAII